MKRRDTILARLQSGYEKHLKPKQRKRLEQMVISGRIRIIYTPESKKAMMEEINRKWMLKQLGPRVFKLDEDF